MLATRVRTKLPSLTLNAKELSVLNLKSLTAADFQAQSLCSRGHETKGNTNRNKTAFLYHFPLSKPPALRRQTNIRVEVKIKFGSVLK